MPLYTRGSRKATIVLSYFFCSVFGATAQEQNDTLTPLELEEVVIKAYEQNRRIKEIPAAVNYVGRSVLERFSPASIIQAINTTPGVRMEERSPGSYRFNIRGSALRSTFGVRNVKVYYNDLPFTNPGGNTYLNAFGYYNFGSLEIIKGPGSSLYGAGTGGVLLIDHLTNDEQTGVVAEYTTGSYGLQNLYGAVVTGTEKFKSKSSIQHQESNGYRNHSVLKRSIASWSGSFKWSETQILKTTFIYSDLYYQTPGGLTASEYNANPKAARPGNAFFPGAQTAQASVTQKTFLAGASYSQPLFNLIQTRTALYGSYTRLRNPAIQNYGRIDEPHFGGRTTLTYSKILPGATLTINGGAEWQQGFTASSVHQNKNGIADTLQQQYEVSNKQSLLFAQAVLDVAGFSVVAGASLNNSKVVYQAFFPKPEKDQQRSFQNKLAPRLALSKKWKASIVYATVAKGFSPPTTEEFFPSGNNPNINLEAEDGTNYDIGFRSTIKKVSIDINAFYFSLQNTIVQRRTAGGGSEYTNAGNTAQKGIESGITIPLLLNNSFIDRSSIWINYTYHDFEYKSFTKDTNNFSGKSLPGIAPHTLSTGYTITANNGLTATVSYLYSDEVPLNDANTVFAKSYHLLGVRIGFEKKFKKKLAAKLMLGGDNLLNETYSLGNDVNAFGGRYFNAAPQQNWHASLSLQWLK